MLLAGCLALLAAGPAPGGSFERPLGETPVADVLQLQRIGRELVALDAGGGDGPRERLEIGERVLASRSRGRVGMVVTDRRLLAVAVGSGAWQAERFLRGEAPPVQLLLGERVALAVTSRRALGFDGGSGNLVERSLGPREQLLAHRVGGNVAVVVTDRRALGLSPFAGGFFPAALRVGESIESVDASANFATVRTTHRLLTFRAPSGFWSEQGRDLR